jgi:uncharacterized membrane protein YkvA (DUF1232 family)
MKNPSSTGKHSESAGSILHLCCNPRGDKTTSQAIYGEPRLMREGDIVSSGKTPGPRSPAADPDVAPPEAALSRIWSQQAQRLQREAYVFYFAFKHPRVRWYARLVAICTAIYLFSPIQLIPSYIPVIGFLDDFLLLFLGIKLLQRIVHPEVINECRELAEAAEMQRKNEIRSTAATVGMVAIVFLWLIVGVTASLVMVKYLRR